MEIRINKRWVIYSSRNNSGVILGRIPENKQDDPDLDVSKLGSANMYHYATVSGAVQGLLKRGVLDSDAKSFAELEQDLQRIAHDCQAAFSTEQMRVLHSESMRTLMAEYDAIKLELVKLKKEIAEKKKP